MEAFVKDLRYCLRMMAQNPAWTAVAVVTLALGIGANTTLFSVVNGVLLNPLPYPQPDRLIALYSRTADSPRWSISYPNFLDWVRDNRSFSALAGYRSEDYNLTGMGEPERLPGEMVSATFFLLLGVKPALGRMFLPEEDQVGGRPVVLISDGLWKRKFGSAPDAVGKTVTLNGEGYTIVGVIPASFHYSGNNFGSSTDVYAPIGQWNDPTFRDRRIGMGMDAVGRLKPGVTFGQAKADMDVLGQHLAEEHHAGPAEAKHGGRYPAISAGAGGRSCLCSLDCMREHCQSPIGTLDVPHPGICGPHRHGRRRKPHHPATADRKHPTRLGRRGPGRAAWFLGATGGAQSAAGGAAPG